MIKIMLYIIYCEFSNRLELKLSHKHKPISHPYDDGQMKEQKMNLNFLICILTRTFFLFPL